jgi:peptidoglycan-associated lipoprotein
MPYTSFRRVMEVLMKWNVAAGLLALLAVEMHEAPPADACGVKLTVKSQAPRKAVTRTANPSDVLLLGSPPRRLELDLSAAGHRVDVAPNAAAAKKKNYAVVVADADKQNEARSSFGDAAVVVRSGDVGADMRSVERSVGRKPLRTEEGRTVVAARPSRTPIAAGGGEMSRRPVSAKEKEPSESEAGSAPPERVATQPRPPVNETRPERTATQPRPPAEPKPERVTTQPKPPVNEAKPVDTGTPPPEPKPRTVAKVSAAPAEVYFSTGSTRLSSQAEASLARTIRWLKASPDVNVVVEGHADPIGNPDSNLALGQQRAELVKGHLVAAGIDASRIEVISYGDTRLKYGKTDPRNRRAAVVAK